MLTRMRFGLPRPAIAARQSGHLSTAAAQRLQKTWRQGCSSTGSVHGSKQMAHWMSDATSPTAVKMGRAAMCCGGGAPVEVLRSGYYASKRAIATRRGHKAAARAAIARGCGRTAALALPKRWEQPRPIFRHFRISLWWTGSLRRVGGERAAPRAECARAHGVHMVGCHRHLGCVRIGCVHAHSRRRDVKPRVPRGHRRYVRAASWGRWAALRSTATTRPP